MAEKTMTTNIGWVNGITTNKAAGDLLGSTIDPDPNATVAFPTPLRLIGSTSDTPAAWFGGACLTQAGLDQYDELAGAGPFTLLQARGLTAEQIAAGKDTTVYAHGPRAIHQDNGPAFIAAHGYERMPIPDDPLT